MADGAAPPPRASARRSPVRGRGSPVAEADDAARALAEIRAETATVRAALAALREQQARLQQAMNESRAAQLREANEHLLLAALQAQAVADTARHEIDILTRMTQRDILTGLPNRALMLDRLENALARARRQGSCLALLFVDLDRFKFFNDTRGHAIGDALLRAAARCLEAAVRDSDTVSRHGGDEFLILLPEVAAASDAAQVAVKILAALDDPGGFGDPALRMTASVGVAIYPEDGSDAVTLIEAADAAMYRAKRDGGGRFGFRAAQPAQGGLGG